MAASPARLKRPNSESLNDWVESQGLPRGQIGFDYADPVTGAQKALFDLAWPDGLQSGLSAPVAVLLNETRGYPRLGERSGFPLLHLLGGFPRLHRNRNPAPGSGLIAAATAIPPA